MRIPLVKIIGGIVLVVVLSLSSTGTGSAAEVDTTLGLADLFLAEGEFYRAVTEYRRALFLLGEEEEERVHAVLGVAQAYYEGGDYPRAAAWCRQHLREFEGHSARPFLLRFFLLASIRSGEVELAYHLSEAESGEVADFCGAIATAHLGDWSSARERFDLLADSNDIGGLARWNEGVAASLLATERKSPGLAAGLAVVPGMGYLYVGHKQSAVSAFLINSLLIGSAISAYRNSMWELGGILTFFGAGWYGGNIYGSYFSAIRYNERIDQTHLERLRE